VADSDCTTLDLLAAYDVTSGVAHRFAERGASKGGKERDEGSDA